LDEQALEPKRVPRRLDQQPRHDRVRDCDPVNFPSLELGKKSSRIHDNRGNITATRFSCTKRDTRLRMRPAHTLVATTRLTSQARLDITRRVERQRSAG